MTERNPEDRADNPREHAAQTVREITDLMFQLSVETEERERFLADPSTYLSERRISERAREIVGSLNEKLILGQIYELRPDWKPVPVLYTYTTVDVIDSVIVSPVTFIAVWLEPGVAEGGLG